jgi:hypothetical protein
MKSVGEPMSIAFDRLIESKRGNAIDFCQVAIQHHSHAADCADHSVNLLYCDRGFSFLRHRRERLFKNSSEEKREERMKEELGRQTGKGRRKNYEMGASFERFRIVTKMAMSSSHSCRTIETLSGGTIFPSTSSSSQ